MLGQIPTPKKLCLLRLSAIGDVCHAVAMVQHIQQQCPDIEITWVIGKIEAALLSGLPGVNFVIFDKKAGLKGYKDLRHALRDESFDVLLHMQVAFRASIAAWCIRAKVKLGFDRQRAKEGQFLFTNKKTQPMEQPHVLEGFFGFAQALGLPPSTPKWQMPIPESDEQWATETLQTSAPIAVISPAASKAERNWHTTGYASVASKLAKRGFKVVICGGPTALEQQLAIDICHKSEETLLNLVGKTSLKQLLAVLKKAHVVIAPDTGPAHMAVTVNTPVVGLYAHSNPKRTGPYLYQKYVASCYESAIKEQYQKSSAELPWGIRAKGATLMQGITEAQVMEKVNRLIEDYYPELS